MKVSIWSMQFTHGYLQKVKESVLKRFYLALLLFQLWSGMGIWEASEMFRIHRGFTQQALSSASAFASCVFHFCQVIWLKVITVAVLLLWFMIYQNLEFESLSHWRSFHWGLVFVSISYSKKNRLWKSLKLII